MLTKEIYKKIELVYNDNQFLGNSLIFTDEEISQIYDEVGVILRRIGSAYGDTIRVNEYKIVAIALVELTKEWEADEDTWLEFISKKLLGSQSDISGKIYKQICKCLDNLSMQRNFFMFDCFKKRYYTAVCSHAFAPKSSVFSFFDMCWEVYCKDLFQQYSHDDQILELIVDSLKNKFSYYKSDDDDISIGSNVYAFRAGIKGLAIDQGSLMVGLLDTALSCINSLINNEPINVDTYFKKLLKEWWISKESSFGLKKEKSVVRHEYVAKNYSQIKSKYIFEDGKAKLVVSSFRLIDNFDYEPCIEIKVNSQIVKSESIPTRGSGIIMTTKAIEYELDSLSLKGNDEIVVEITHNAKTIYNSKNTLKREFILFATNKELNSQSLLPGTYFIYTPIYMPKINDIVRSKDIRRITKNLYSFVAQEGDVVCLNDRIVFFETEKTNKDIYFLSSEKQDIFYRENGVTYKIIDGDLCVDVREDYDVTDLGVRYPDGAFPLSEFDYTVNNGRKKFKISILAEAGEPVNISVFKYSNNYILDAVNIIKFNNISITYDKNLYYGENSIGTVDFKTEKYNLKDNFDITNEENSIEFGEGEIVFNPPILKWRFDQNEWNIRPQSAFYYKKITNSSLLEISMPLNMDCLVGLTNGKILEKLDDKRIYKIGQTIHSLDSSSLKEVTIFVKSGFNRYEISRVFLKQNFIDDPIYVKSEEYKIEWNPETFIGEDGANLKLQVFDENTLSPLYERTLQMKSKETINMDTLKEGYYKLRIVMIGRGFLAKEIELLNKRYLFGNIKSMRFKNKIIKIYKALIFDKLSSEYIKPIYVSDIKYLGNKYGSDFYFGRLFIMDKGRRIYLNYMKSSISGQDVRINPIRIELMASSSCCYLGYGLDINDPDFEYDDEFVLDFDGKTTIGTKLQKNKHVDFYVFQEQDDEEGVLIYV